MNREIDELSIALVHIAFIHSFLSTVVVLVMMMMVVLVMLAERDRMMLQALDFIFTQNFPTHKTLVAFKPLFTHIEKEANKETDRE